MVIGYDQVNADTPRGFGRLESPDAGVDADNNSYSARCCPFNYVILNAVAFLDPMRYVEISCAAAQLNRGFQDDDCCCPIYVIVAIDEDPFFIRDGGTQALHGGGHAVHEVGRMQMIE